MLRDELIEPFLQSQELGLNAPHEPPVYIEPVRDKDHRQTTHKTNMHTRAHTHTHTQSHIHNELQISWLSLPMINGPPSQFWLRSFHLCGGPLHHDPCLPSLPQSALCSRADAASQGLYHSHGGKKTNMHGLLPQLCLKDPCTLGPLSITLAVEKQKGTPEKARGKRPCKWSGALYWPASTLSPCWGCNV